MDAVDVRLRRASNRAHRRYPGEAVADERVHVVRGQEKAGGGAEAGEADAEAHGKHMLDVDADQARALAFFGARSNRPA